jgi:hypothetical protein
MNVMRDCARLPRLIDALLDDAMADFQDAFLSGPPPLGPGAPASALLEAFIDERLRLLR